MQSSPTTIRLWHSLTPPFITLVSSFTILHAARGAVFPACFERYNLLQPVYHRQITFLIPHNPIDLGNERQETSILPLVVPTPQSTPPTNSLPLEEISTRRSSIVYLLHCNIICNACSPNSRVPSSIDEARLFAADAIRNGENLILYSTGPMNSSGAFTSSN